MRRIFTVLFIGALSFCSLAAEMRSSVSQFGITWTFDKEYECGRFVNGDWWVKGPVTVSDISPRPAIFSPPETGGTVAGYLWWSGTFWCVSQNLGEAVDYNWRNYNTRIDTIFGWWDGETDRSSRHDREIDMQILGRTFSKYDQTGDFEGMVYLASSSGLRAWDEGVYLESADSLNGQPVYTLGHLINGSMVNPVTGTQSYDNRVSSYYFETATEFPATLQPDQSLVSSISLTTTNCVSSQGEGNLSLADVCIPYYAERPKVKTAAVLTCVNAPLTEATFRPGFCGDDKKYYTADQVRWDILPALAPVADTPELEYYIRGVERPWLTHIADASARELHPMDNMLDYHAKVYEYYKDASLLLMLDLPGKDTLVNRVIQNGIDTYGMVLLGWGSSATAKFPILFSGLMLDDAEIKNVFKDSTSQTPFREDWMSYYGSEGTSSLTSDIVADDMCWTGYTVPSGDHAGEAVMWRQDPDDAEHEHMHPSEWAPIPPSGGGCKHESYRNINSVNWPGMGLCVLLMDGKDLWHHDAYFDYIDRWMDEDMSPFYAVLDSSCGGHSTGYQSAGSVFANEMWAAYRDSVPEQTGIYVSDIRPRTSVGAVRFYRLDGKPLPEKPVSSGMYLQVKELHGGTMQLVKKVIIR